MADIIENTKSTPETPVSIKVEDTTERDEVMEMDDLQLSNNSIDSNADSRTGLEGDRADAHTDDSLKDTQDSNSPPEEEDERVDSRTESQQEQKGDSHTESELMDSRRMDTSQEDSIGMDIEEPEQVQELGPAALGLRRVGSQPPIKKLNPPSQPVQVLNRRGMPARIRKKNKMFYDDILVNPPHHRVKKEPNSAEIKQSPRKMTRPSPLKRQMKLLHEPKRASNTSMTSSSNSTPSSQSSTNSSSKLSTPIKEDRRAPEKHTTPVTSVPTTSPDRKIGQKIGMRLRNLLKLPKAHKWVCYEWFYSNIDKTLFEGDNDFMICLKESFPQLKTRKLTRVEWCKIRRMMGKPRRCSQSFFEEERRELERKRQKIRMLQQRKASDINSFKDLPPEIPLQLVIGTKVTARLRKPQDGLFTGSIDAVDTSNNTYRITFERAGLGTHSVPDYEVLSNEAPETISVASFAQKFRPRHHMTHYVPSPAYAMKLSSSASSSPRLNNDPLISNTSMLSAINANVQPKKSHIGGTMNGYPLKLLEFMVKVNKILALKKIKIKRLKEMNSEAEKKRSRNEPLPPDFERRYAGVVVDLERMNIALQDFLNDVQELCQEIAPEPSVAAMLAPSHLRERCRQEAADVVGKHNMINDKAPTKMNDLVTDLIALMLQLKSLSDSDQNAYELKVLQGTMEQIKSKLTPNNQQLFQNCIEIHMQHIQLGLSQIGALTPFMTQKI